MGNPQLPSRSRTAKRALTAALSLVIALLCVEIGTRVFLRRHWDTAVIAAASARINIRSLITFVDDKELLYGLRPDLDGEWLTHLGLALLLDGRA